MKIFAKIEKIICFLRENEYTGFILSRFALWDFAFWKDSFCFGNLFLFCFEGISEKILKNKALFLLRKGAFTKRKKRKCDTANYNPNG